MLERSLVAGKYRIIEEIGRGGMGIVFRAEDTKLGRPVAIKVLPEAFTRDAERLGRFEREARVLAALNHPNVASVYGVEEAEEERFLVMELVEGATLAERLAKGPLALEDALSVCRQIAEGLEAAHDKAIVHRDLKPANIKLSPDGRAKILDFGLAKSVQGRPRDVDTAESPTMTADMTQPGFILGTAAYMSPEQAAGKSVDRRADIWAFGCVLFECLTGKRAFPGETVTDSLAAVLRGEPDWSALPSATPENVSTLLRRCLTKNARDRLRDIGDARLEIVTPMSSVALPTQARRPGVRIQYLAGGAAVMLLAGVLAGRFLAGPHRPKAPDAVINSTLKLAPKHWLEGMRRRLELQRPSRRAIAIAHDGSFIVYSAIEENPGPEAKPRIFRRDLDQPEARPLAGTEGGINPFISPDDRWVGFWADGKLRKAPAGGGVPTDLCDVAMLFGAEWGPNGKIAFADGEAAGLSLVSAEGGTPDTVSKPDPRRHEYGHRLPSWLPSGEGLLFTVMKHASDVKPRVELLRLDTGERQELLEDAADARLISRRRLIFLRKGTLMAARFDLERPAVRGHPVPVLENVMQAYSSISFIHSLAGQFAVSDSGALLYAAGGVVPDMKNSLVWVDHEGMEQEAASQRAPYLAPRLSPDGRRVIYQTIGSEIGVYLLDLVTGISSRLTEEGTAGFPIWMPEGRNIVFAGLISNVENLFLQPCDGSAPAERLTNSVYGQFPASWSADGKKLAIVEQRADTADDVVIRDMGSGALTTFLNSPAREMFPEFSPDARWLAYTSDASGRDEVYIRPFPGPGVKLQVSSEGGVQPLWAKDGKRLYYRRGDQVWAVDIRIDGGLSGGKPLLLFEKPGYLGAAPVRGYDLSTDGRRFLLVKLEQRNPDPVTEMTLIQKWIQSIERFFPADAR